MGHVESRFQAGLIRELENLYPGCIILKNDPNYRQGIPDLLMLWGDRWAAFECKAAMNSSCQPNQLYYVDLMCDMSFAAFICPENKEGVLRDLQRAFGCARSRVPERQQVPLDKLRRGQASRVVPERTSGSARN